MRPHILASAPTRLDFGGGWTDVPPYPEERGGFVCSLAISRLASVRLAPCEDGVPGADEQSPLLKAALRLAQIECVQASLSSNFPYGAGLGGSSAAGVAVAAALARWQGKPHDPTVLAEWSRTVEVSELGIAGGRQDHYAAAFGGALALSFRDNVGVERIPLSDTTRTALENRCVVIFTGESRISAAMITSVLDAYRSGNARVLHALERMGSLASRMAIALRAGDVDELGLLVGEHWQFQQALHPAITTSRIDAIQDAALRAGALGLKALGASGGGCVVVIAPEGGARRITEAVLPFGEILDWRVATEGVQVEEVGTPDAHAPG